MGSCFVPQTLNIHTWMNFAFLFLWNGLSSHSPQRQMSIPKARLVLVFKDLLIFFDMIWDSMKQGHILVCMMNFLRFSYLLWALFCFSTRTTKGYWFDCLFFTDYQLWKRTPNVLNFIDVSIWNKKDHCHFWYFYHHFEERCFFIIIFFFLQSFYFLTISAWSWRDDCPKRIHCR